MNEAQVKEAADKILHEIGLATYAMARGGARCYVGSGPMRCWKCEHVCSADELFGDTVGAPRVALMAVLGGQQVSRMPLCRKCSKKLEPE